ncbi:hypothetical protein CRUP_026064 [Coryphaenoides rupestris]|nr:hypothetical protein CRUP_026064 [Coryphaenoides rupestris]
MEPNGCHRGLKRALEAAESVSAEPERTMAEKVDMEGGGAAATAARRPTGRRTPTSRRRSPTDCCRPKAAAATPAPKRRSPRVRRIVLANLLVILTVAGSDPTRTQVIYVGVPRPSCSSACLKMIIIPLVVCSLVSGAGQASTQGLGKLGGWAMLFFSSPTLISSVHSAW